MTMPHVSIRPLYKFYASALNFMPLHKFYMTLSEYIVRWFCPDIQGRKVKFI